MKKKLNNLLQVWIDDLAFLHPYQLDYYEGFCAMNLW